MRSRCGLSLRSLPWLSRPRPAEPSATSRAHRHSCSKPSRRELARALRPRWLAGLLDSGEVPKFSLTTQHYSAPRAHSDGSRPISQAILDHPTFIPRLTWKYTSRVSIEDINLPETIAGAGDAVFFCDSSVFNDRLDPAIVEAMLAVPDRLVLTPFVIAESKEWLGRRPSHPLTKAIAKKEAKVMERKPPASGTTGRSGYLYYLWLLLMRRRPFEVAEMRFRDEHEREPNEQEQRELRAKVHKDLGPRGFMLASKGFSEVPTDEAISILAVEYALSTGRIAHVVTGDADVEDQFAKLIWLIDTHYRGMLLADRYSADFARFAPRPFDPPPAFRKHPETCPFELENATLIERGPAHLEHVLPTQPHCVAISCWHVSSSFSSMTFMAEQEMRSVLEVKDRTGGLNTDKLAGRNLHPWLAPLPLRSEDRDCALVAYDKRVALPYKQVAIPQFDILQCVANLERKTRFEGIRDGPTQIVSAAGTPTIHGDLIVVTDKKKMTPPGGPLDRKRAEDHRRL